MRTIGKYNGIVCYECTEKEYRDLCNSGRVDGNIYIIDETMVRNNIIVGYYNGKSVRDVYDAVPYMVKREPGPEREMTPVKEERKEEPITEIVFSDYSRVVDEFFENLGVES